MSVESRRACMVSEACQGGSEKYCQSHVSSKSGIKRGITAGVCQSPAWVKIGDASRRADVAGHS